MGYKAVVPDSCSHIERRIIIHHVDVCRKIFLAMPGLVSEQETRDLSGSVDRDGLCRIPTAPTAIQGWSGLRTMCHGGVEVSHNFRRELVGFEPHPDRVELIVRIVACELDRD